MTNHLVVSHDAWIQARTEFLEQEKQFTRARDALSAARRALPWEKVEKPYHFTGPNGEATLSDLFAVKSQLVVYHFMLGPGLGRRMQILLLLGRQFRRHRRSSEGSRRQFPRRPACAAVQASRLSEAYGLVVSRVSSYGSDFNFDYQVSFSKEQLDAGKAYHNYEVHPNTMSELAGFSVFFKDEGGNVFHTYSTYARGLDMLNGAYHILDLVPKGRDEAGLKSTMGSGCAATTSMRTSAASSR